VHRLVLSCPGEIWCHRSGCDQVELADLELLLGLHPLADGSLLGPAAGPRAEVQLIALLHTIGILDSAGVSATGQAAW
jgi:hypothetical protein